MDILAGIMGVTSIIVVVLGLGLILLGQKVGTWKRLTRSEKEWQQKIAQIAFNYVMPAGIVISVFLIPLLVLLGVVTFVVMLFAL